MRTRVTVVHLFVCLFVCLLPVYCLLKTFIQQNEHISQFSPNSKGFQLRDFTKKLSLTSYSLFFIFSIAKSAIFHSQYCKLGLNPLRILLVVMSITIYGYRITVHRPGSTGQTQLRNPYLPRGSAPAVSNKLNAHRSS